MAERLFPLDEVATLVIRIYPDIGEVSTTGDESLFRWTHAEYAAPTVEELNAEWLEVVAEREAEAAAEAARQAELSELRGQKLIDMLATIDANLTTLQSQQNDATYRRIMRDTLQAQRRVIRALARLV